MRSKFFPQLLRVLGFVLLLVPLLLIGWFLPDLPGIFGDSGSGGRRKPMSAEAKFLWMVFVLLLGIGFIGWWLWRQREAN